MAVLVIVMVLVCIGIPMVYAWRVWRLDEPSLSAWLLRTGEALAIVAFILLVGRWDMAGLYSRFLLVGLVTLAVLWSLRRHAHRPWRIAGRSLLRTHWTGAVSVGLFAAALVYTLSGMAPPGGERPLAFPLRDGRFVIGQGGGSVLLNRHASHRAQRYAADIVAVGPAGFRATGLLPGDLDGYAVYGVRVVSPCDGTVTEARDGLPDLVPPERDRDNPAGNHVALDCGGVTVELAHLRRGSVAVAPGARVDRGDPIGRVGNSGNTTEPHLHIHAVDPRTGKGVPMSFAGRYPVRNAVFSR
ncbi:MAG: M23 family metallopeptidase [Sphingomonadales bacterium]